MSKVTNEKQELLLMACPYCGSKDVSETERTSGHMVEMVDGCCLSCDEEFCVIRYLEEKDENTN